MLILLLHAWGRGQVRLYFNNESFRAIMTVSTDIINKQPLSYMLIL
jgi:hypothetical protein